jgi:hypothetical protein
MLPENDKEKLLEDASGRLPGNYVTISIRDLISLWGAKRRGYLIVDDIERDLKRYKITTYPPFDQGWIDSQIELIPSVEEYVFLYAAWRATSSIPVARRRASIRNVT